jgi:hypothetical protein
MCTCNINCLVSQCGACCSTGTCGYCSQCVGSAACNPVLCSSCITGDTTTCATDGMCGPIAGTNASLCANVDVSTCLPFAGTDGNGNEIYQNQDGTLVYSDGSPATRADIACNCGACRGTPCSPRTCGTSDQPPHGNASAPGGPSGGGSGGGSAKPAGGTPTKTSPTNCLASKLSQAMNHFGSTLASLLSGGKTTTAANVLPGQKMAVAAAPMSSNTFLLILIVIGGLLLWLTFGHKPEGD